ncbi:hypothetical protein W824_05015 [Clavibacter cf. michiganensis LMG 26808]|nr:hypothetical protein W824_05015 [Clavibacter cf. michiganensis LMG 26808]
MKTTVEMRKANAVAMAVLRFLAIRRTQPPERQADTDGSHD